jgi:hypothetical protein
MSELETRLRDILEAAAPQGPTTDGLVAGARRYAVRARRARLVTAAVLAVAVLAGGLATAESFRNRALPPAHHVEHLDCAGAGRHAGPVALDDAARLSDQVREALVCPDLTPQSVWPGFLHEDQPVSGVPQLDYLSFEPRGSDAGCASARPGRSYRLLLLLADGRVSATDNTQLRCNGWPALDRYLVALGDQAAGERADQLDDPFPRCTSVLHQLVRPASGGPPSLAKGTTFTGATVCYHPLADPHRAPTSDALVVGRAAFGDLQLAALDAELARHGSTKTPHRTCPAPVDGILVIHAVTSEGRAVTLSQACAYDNPTALVDWTADDTIDLGPALLQVIRDLLP